MTIIWTMLTSGRMVKGLLLGVALLMLPLAFGCGSSSDAETEEQDTVAEAMAAATEVADQQERTIAKAWAMAQVATSWAAIDPVAAQQAVADSVRAAEQAASDGDEQRSVAAELREQSATWDPVDWRQAIALAERIERNASRAWVLRAIAGELANVDPAQASSLLATALEIAEANPLPQYQAADKSTVAIELDELDADSALEVAAAIADPAAKARALREMSALLAETDPKLAADILADALEAARQISNPNDRAWALRESAVAPAVDAAQAGELLAEAEEAAGQIDDVEPQAFALSDLAIAWATLDLGQAEAVLEDISHDYPEASVAALVGIAARISASNSDKAGDLLEQAYKDSEQVLDTYERAQVVNAVVTGMATLDKERAEEIAREIEDPYLQADALRSLALVVAGADADDAVSLAEAIQPRFIRVQAMIAVGDTVAAGDAEKAVSIFEQALSEAGELDDTYPLRELASAWAPLDPAKALEIAEKVEDPPDQVQAMTDVALAMLATDPEKARVTFETAHETAQSIKSDDDPFAAATALRDMAAVWLSVDEAEAGRLYADAFKLAAAVELEPTG
jgi:hypothetical protein